MRATVVWIALAAAILVPVAIAATSPLLAYRQPIYVAAGLAGVLGLCVLLLQPLLAGGYLPGLSARMSRLIHRVTGATLVALIVIHVAGLWITSPPDMIDALTFTSPTPFSPFGVIAMWAIFATATIAAIRRRLGLRPFRLAHTAFGLVIVGTTVLHAVLIEGTMGTLSKWALSLLVLAAMVKVVLDRRVLAPRR